MEYFLQQLLNGLTLGSIYGLIAIGYTMVYGIIGMINFAHGDIFMLGAFIAMIVFLILATVLYHPFWAFAGDARAPHVSAFGINSALCGGALVLIAATL